MASPLEQPPVSPLGDLSHVPAWLAWIEGRGSAALTPLQMQEAERIVNAPPANCAICAGLGGFAAEHLSLPQQYRQVASKAAGEPSLSSRLQHCASWAKRASHD